MLIEQRKGGTKTFHPSSQGVKDSPITYKKKPKPRIRPGAHQFEFIFRLNMIRR